MVTEATFTNITPSGGLDSVFALGVDGSGNVYVADNSGTIEEWQAPAGSTSPTPTNPAPPPQPTATPVTLGSLQTEVVGNFGLNTANAILGPVPLLMGKGSIPAICLPSCPDPVLGNKRTSRLSSKDSSPRSIRNSELFPRGPAIR